MRIQKAFRFGRLGTLGAGVGLLITKLAVIPRQNER
jgi:hypothetical protein